MQQRGRVTRGRVARAVAGAEAIEIKATVPNHQVRQALAHFGLTTRNDEVRLIYFFDTPALDLLGAGIIARARRAIGDEHDSTIKFRPAEPDRIAARWRKFRDFKIEVDASEKDLVKAASFSMPVAKGLIKRVAAGRRPIESLFTAAQEEFLQAVAGHGIDFGKLAVLGPLRAQRWRVQDPACPWPITAELWRRDDGQQLMEVSIKAPIVQAAVAIAGFMAYLAEVGAERDDQEQSKSRWAMAHYAARLDQAPGPKPPARKAATKRPAGKKAATKRT